MEEALQQGILRLIYSAISGEKLSLPEGFELEKAMPLIRAHQLGNMVYYGAANCGIDTELPVMRALFAVTCKSVLVDERQRYELKRLMESFDANGIDYMPVKGVIMKKLYPRTDMRIMGDADILIRMSQYDRIKDIVAQLGYEFKVQTDHELVWDHPNLHLELHKRLIPDYNVEFASYYGDCWHLGKPSQLNPHYYEMNDEDHMIFLFTHFAKHYRTGGIGIRHMTDLYVYKKAKPKLDENYIARELKKLKLLDFYKNVFDTLTVWFENGEANYKTEMITEHIFSSGAYGTSSRRFVAMAIHDKGETGKTSKQLQRKTWFNIIFLPYASMCIKYPILRKVPVLLPVMWVARGVNVLIQKPKKILQQRRRIALLNEDKLDEYEVLMNAVGLSFHFEEKDQ